MVLPWHNSASEMFVNLNIKSFGEMSSMICIRYLFKGYDIWESMLLGIYNSLALFILNYGLGGEYYDLLTCDWPQTFIF